MNQGRDKLRMKWAARLPELNAEADHQVVAAEASQSGGEFEVRQAGWRK
jgi:hypothetical protein